MCPSCDVRFVFTGPRFIFAFLNHVSRHRDNCTHNLWHVRTLHFSTGQENVPWSFHLQVLLGLVANNVLASNREVVKQINDTKAMDDGQWERLYAMHNIDACDCPSTRQRKMVATLREQFGLNLPHGNALAAYSEHFKERCFSRGLPPFFQFP